MNDLERLLSRITISDEGCWIYPCTKHDGYALVRIETEGGTKVYRAAHRFTYEMMVGPIPEGHHIDHLCRVRACVNPEHLEAVTPAENVRRSLPFRQPAPRQRVQRSAADIPSDPAALLTYDEVASYLRVSRVTVKRYVRIGDLEAINTKGPRRRIVRKSLDQFIARNNP